MRHAPDIPHHNEDHYAYDDRRERELNYRPVRTATKTIFVFCFTTEKYLVISRNSKQQPRPKKVSHFQRDHLGFHIIQQPDKATKTQEPRKTQDTHMCFRSGHL